MGWTYNTADDAANSGVQITVTAIALTSASLIILLVRFYVRAVLIKAIGADDWVLIPTWIASCGFAVVTIVQTKWGLGLQHVDDMPVQNIYNFGLIQYMGAPFYISSIFGFKLSLMLSYLRFMTKGGARTATICIMIACAAFHIAFLLVQVNLCQPAAKQWDPTITWGTCLKAVPVYTSMASLTIIFDIAVMVLPFPVLFRTQIPRRKKVALLGLFALGTFITIIQIIRIRTIRNLANYLDSSKLIMWSTVENNLGIIVASIPTLAPLFKYFAERTQKNSSARSRSSKGSRSTMYVLRSVQSGKTSGTPPSRGRRASHILGYDRAGSEEFILGDGAITKTTEVVVASEGHSTKGGVAL
ncbi:hypothetical protein T440DRAFT_470518 [Plenodomus tracheiphilus IPT5]|uniref:Rhodopsin domain-containing protein n=1 Tax=Plenodomus tracheiphilus IPT5 TaxID=1408161 RepID=A0A6A7B182_9PLEO|nr:hypothetical protein T440DRAFT_470518 [Plenodomus tracheiphilus IPT5]